MADSDYQDTLARLRRIPPSLTLGVVVLASVAMMSLDVGSDYVRPVRSVLAMIGTPFQAAASLPSEAIDYLERYLDRGALIDANERLRQKNLQLRARLQKLASLKTRNERLRSLLGSAGSIDRHVQIAQVLSTNPDPYRHRIKLDKGQNDGVFVGQALIDAHGIVGQVVRVESASSHAVLITDPNHGIPVEINRNGLETIARGTGRAATLESPFLPANTDVREGDLLVSSGLAGRYPAGYPVARVDSVSHDTGQEFLQVTAKPTASLARGREVLLVWNRNTAPSRVDNANEESAS
ncbi:rod shape-determining protein MreC [Salinisphaera sp. USBA-960]|nr:rod shape-determining protein MreC [Salifodinibacter halophilus]NNC26937.1 rod shape-determining protein MreC [Salifodinibacter halophilus]